MGVDRGQIMESSPYVADDFGCDCRLVEALSICECTGDGHGRTLMLVRSGWLTGGEGSREAEVRGREASLEAARMLPAGGTAA